MNAQELTNDDIDDQIGIVKRELYDLIGEEKDGD